MAEHEQALEQDGRFPSGSWTGFFLQRPSTARHWVELQLTFRGGTLRGDGHDEIGAFTLDGHYNLADGRCWWTKRYVGQHEVSYAGHNEGKGIWGVWEIPPRSRGGFHIWPAGMADPTQATRTIEEHSPVQAVTRHGPTTSVSPSWLATSPSSRPVPFWTLSPELGLSGAPKLTPANQGRARWGASGLMCWSTQVASHLEQR
jgi:hypothetical protein